MDLEAVKQIAVLNLCLLFVMKITALILAYLTIRHGADLIKAGATGQFKFSAGLNGSKAELASLSPGLLFVLLGIILIGYSIWVKKAVDVPTCPSSKNGIYDGHLPPMPAPNNPAQN